MDHFRRLLLENSAKQGSVFSAEWATSLACVHPRATPEHLNECFRTTLHWPCLVKLAEDHGILPLLTLRIRDTPAAIVPADMQQTLRDASRAQMLFTLSLTAELFRVLDRFAAPAIEVLLTKGPVLSQRCYGDPGIRQYTDLDLIVRDEDIARATEAMIAMEYQARVPLNAIQAKKAPGEYVFSRSGTNLLVEIHTERTFRYHPRPLPVEKIFARQARVRFDGRDVPALSVEDELILICIHGAKHFWERLMWIADVAALVSRQSIDWDRALSAAREVRAERMLRVGLLLAMKVFDPRLPASVIGDLNSDRGAARIAANIWKRLPHTDGKPLGLLSRAAFRMRMRGGLLQGAAYLVRLSFSPTEEDWVTGSEEKRPWMWDALSRPIRLISKYGRGGKE